MASVIGVRQSVPCPAIWDGGHIRCFAVQFLPDRLCPVEGYYCPSHYFGLLKPEQNAETGLPADRDGRAVCKHGGLASLKTRRSGPMSQVESAPHDVVEDLSLC